MKNDCGYRTLVELRVRTETLPCEPLGDQLDTYVRNLLLDSWIAAKTHDFHDYSAAKNLMQRHREWTPEEWEKMCRIVAEYCGV